MSDLWLPELGVALVAGLIVGYAALGAIITRAVPTLASPTRYGVLVGALVAFAGCAFWAAQATAAIIIDRGPWAAFAHLVIWVSYTIWIAVGVGLRVRRFQRRHRVHIRERAERERAAEPREHDRRPGSTVRIPLRSPRVADR